MNYKVTISMELLVEAKNKDIVEEIVHRNAPHISLCGCGLEDGCYGVESQSSSLKITSIVKATP